MVQFGRHQAFFVEHEQRDSDLYVIPYNDAKHSLIAQGDVDAFGSEFRSFLDRASCDFSQRLQNAWREVFATLHHHHHRENDGKNDGRSKHHGHDIDEDDEDEVVRGAPPEKALLLFARMTGDSEEEAKKTQVLEQFKNLHATAALNAEALRKLVKKFDKKKIASATARESTMNGNGNQHSDQHYHSSSCRLLPQVYAANFVVGLSALQQAIELLRFEMGVGDTNYSTIAATPTSPSTPGNNISSGKPPLSPKVKATQTTAHQQVPSISIATINNATKTSQPPPRQDGDPQFPSLDVRRDSHAENNDMVQRRKAEWLWLQQTCQTLDQKGLLPYAVAHRGFHSPQDRSDLRPIENSLQAYETAWTSGIHYCECDIALTKDERLVLAHDQDFRRLALDDASPASQRHVRDLTLAEILSVALKSGSRPPLLSEVLESAYTIGADRAQLVIEIKPGNREAASALARLWAQQPHLMTACAVVMSFDAFCMHSLQQELDLIFGSSDADAEDGDFLPMRRAYSLGMFPTMVQPPHQQVASKETSGSSKQPLKETPRRPKLLVLTVCDSAKRDFEMLCVNVVSEDDRAKLASWIKALDGVYLQFQPEMVKPEGLEALRKLSRRYHVGVWGHNGKDPDDVHTLEQLVHRGQVTFVNTDLPRCFFYSGCGVSGSNGTVDDATTTVTTRIE